MWTCILTVCAVPQPTKYTSLSLSAYTNVGVVCFSWLP